MRTFVVGDPQAPFAAVMAVLDHHGLLDGDRLRGDVRLVAIGDYFDYDLDDPVGAGLEGLRVLRWLVSHDEEQVVLLAGNHDLARVMELAQIDDATFARARALGRDIIHQAAQARPHKAAAPVAKPTAKKEPALKVANDVHPAVADAQANAKASAASAPPAAQAAPAAAPHMPGSIGRTRAPRALISTPRSARP